MAGDTTKQMLSRVSYLPDREATVNGTLLAGQEYDNVYIAGGTLFNVTIDADSINLASPLSITSGGTGANNVVTARQNLGLEIGVNVQAYSSVLQNTTASFTTTDETKLDGIEAGAQVNPTTEQIQDASWSVLGGTQTGITVTYQDATNDVDFVVGGLTTTQFTSPNISQWTNDANYVTVGTAIDAVEAANNTFTGTNIFQGVVDVTNVNAETSAGIALRNASGANIITLGAGGGVNTTIAETLLITGSSASSAHILLREDTDNGTNSVKIEAPASLTADRTLTAPDATGTIATQEYVDTQVNTARINLQTAVSTTSGSVINLTGIPTGVSRVSINFINVSVSAVCSPSIQLRDSGGLETSGYVGGAFSIAGAFQASVAMSSGFDLSGAGFDAAPLYSGTLFLSLSDTNTWNISGQLGTNTGANYGISGHKILTDTLDGLSLLTNSAATFDNGKISISWEF